MSEFIIIDWEADRLTGVEARATRGDVQVLRAFREPWPEGLDPARDHARTGTFLKSVLGEHGVTAAQALVVLARESVFARRLDLPQAPDVELPDLVKFQSAAKSSAPVDSLALDYLPWPQLEGDAGRRVLAFTVDRQRMDVLRRTLSAAGLEPAGCGVSSACVASLVVRNARRTGLPHDAPTLLVYQDGPRVEIGILDRSQLVFTHGTRLSDSEEGQPVQPLHAELARSIVALQQAHRGVEIGHVVLLQEGLPDERVRAALDKRFPGLVRVFDPVRDLTGGMRLPAERELVPATALGMLVSHVEPGPVSIDFLNPRRPVVRADRRKLRWALGAATAAGLLLAAWLLFQAALSARDDRIVALKDRKSELDATLKTGDPELKAAGGIGDWHAAAAPPLETLTAFQEQFPGTDRLYFTNLELLGASKGAVARITGTGAARREQDVRELNQTLQDHGHRVKPNVIGRRGRDPDYPVPYVLDVDFMPEQAPGVASASSVFVTAAPRGGTGR